VSVLGIIFAVLLALAVLIALVLFLFSIPDLRRYRRVRKM
jgi:hypothetical protein